MSEKRVLTPDDVRRATTRMAHEIIERNQGLDGVTLIGIQTGGVWLADALGSEIARIDTPIPVGSIDASLYRDDIGLRPVSPASVSDIGFDVDENIYEKFEEKLDSIFEEKVTDIVGLYMNPPTKAMVLCVDEKSQIQALDRTQPGLPLKKGRAATMTHDYKRHGTTTLFAALDVKSGIVIGECQPRHRAKEFIRFLKKIDRIVHKSLDLHLIMDNYATHKTPAVKAWLAKHPRFKMHFIPTSSSWLNLVERFFAEITGKRIRRGAFASVAELQAAIDDYLLLHNASAKPYVWTKPASEILAKERRALNKLNAIKSGNQALDSGHSDVPSQALSSHVIDTVAVGATDEGLFRSCKGGGEARRRR